MAAQLTSEASSDSEHGGTCDTCECKSGGPCHCATPRSTGKTRKGSTTTREGSAGSSGGAAHRLAEGLNQPHFRPVLPRPTPGTLLGTSSQPSSVIPANHPPRHPTHSSMFYSPYGRAYEQIHTQDRTTLATARPTIGTGVAQGQNTVPPHLYQLFTSSPASHPMQNASSQPPLLPPVWPSPTDESFPLCNCGDSCSCPGCLEHRGPGAAGFTSFQTCTNQNSCSSCLSCSILSLPYEAASPEFSDQQSFQLAEELLARIPDLMGGGPQASASHPMATSQQLPPAVMQGYMAGQAWPNYAGSRTTGAMNENTSKCCGGQCKCAVGRCNCPPDCCGCCQGCSCDHCNHEQEGARGLTFAVSGERGACACGSGHQLRQGQGGGDAIRGPGSQFTSLGAARRSSSSSTSQFGRSTSYQSAYSSSSAGVPSAGGSCCSSKKT